MQPATASPSTGLGSSSCAAKISIARVAGYLIVIVAGPRQIAGQSYPLEPIRSRMMCELSLYIRPHFATLLLCLLPFPPHSAMCSQWLYSQDKQPRHYRENVLLIRSCDCFVLFIQMSLSPSRMGIVIIRMRSWCLHVQVLQTASLPRVAPAAVCCAAVIQAHS